MGTDGLLTKKEKNVENFLPKYYLRIKICSTFATTKNYQNRMTSKWQKLTKVFQNGKLL